MNKATGVEARLWAPIARNSAAWEIPDRRAITLFVAAFVPLPGVIFLAATEHPWYYAFSVEDGPLEWLQFAAIVAASGAYLTLAYRLRRAGRRYAPLLSALVAVTALVVAGEEISWGQRLFGWSTPAALDAINFQGETNIHNISAFEFAARLGQFGASAYGTLLPLLALLPHTSHRLRDSYVVPPLALSSFFLVPFTYWAARIPLEPTQPIFQFSEITELYLYAGLALFGLLSVRRLAVQMSRPA